MHAVNKGNIWKQNLEQFGQVPRQRLTLQQIPYVDPNVNVGNLMLFRRVRHSQELINLKKKFVIDKLACRLMHACCRALPRCIHVRMLRGDLHAIIICAPQLIVGYNSANNNYKHASMHVNYYKYIIISIHACMHL